MKGPWSAYAYLAWVAVANSFCADFMVRPKVSLHVSFTILDALPSPRFSSESNVARALVYPALLLTCTSSEMTGLWDILAASGWVQERDPSLPFPGVVDDSARATLRAEIDSIVAGQVYGLTHAQLDCILDTFPIVKRKDEQVHGHYRTKNTILDIYDEMAEVIEANAAAAVAAGREPTARYQTRLDPPPGPPTDEAGNFIPMAQWDPNHWPSHIHPPREAETGS